MKARFDQFGRKRPKIMFSEAKRHFFDLPATLPMNLVARSGNPVVVRLYRLLNNVMHRVAHRNWG